MKTFSWDFQDLILHVKLERGNTLYAPVWKQEYLDIIIVVKKKSELVP